MFHEAMVAARKRKGMSQQELADTLGLSRISIANYETTVQEPGISRALEIAKLLEFSIDGLSYVKLTPEERAEIRRKKKVAKLTAELEKLTKNVVTEK